MSFSNADLLPRRLSPEGCRVAAAQLLAVLTQLSNEKITLPQGVTQAADAVGAATEPLRSASNEVPMNRLDNVADGCVAAVGGAIDAQEQALGGEVWVPLTATEQEHLQSVRAFRAAILPSGTSLVHAKYRVQWERMNTLVTEASRPEWKSTIAALGLSLPLERLARVTEQYGARLGITRIPDIDEDELAGFLDRWHDAMGNLVLATRAAFADPDNEKHLRARRLLLAVYEQQASAERSAEQSKRKSKKDEPVG